MQKRIKPADQRTIVNELSRLYEASRRRICGVFGFRRSVYYYQSRKDEQALLKQKIKDIAYSRVHYGYRRIHVALQREGWKINHKRGLCRICERWL